VNARLPISLAAAFGANAIIDRIAATPGLDATFAAAIKPLAPETFTTRTRRGVRTRTFLSPRDRAAYEAGFDGWPTVPDGPLGTPAMTGFLDAEGAELDRLDALRDRMYGSDE
jgi:hypothetical protein